MKILVTGFDPFGGETVNPALLAVKQLPPVIAGAEIITAEVPTVFGEAGARVAAIIAEQQPDAVVCVGQAGGSACLTPERVAINLIDAVIADNAGQQPVDEPVVADGPAAYFATLPVKAMVTAANAEGVPASLSYSAGSYVCNYLMYSVLHYLATGEVGGAGGAGGAGAAGVADVAGGAGVAVPDGLVRAGFVHVPFVPEQLPADSDKPSLPLPDIVRGLTAMLAAVVNNEGDEAVSMGRIH